MSQQLFKIRRMLSGENQPVPELPREMIFEIMLGLPPPSLIRFSTVSRSWKRIIISKNFKQQHFAKAIASGDDYIISLNNDFIEDKAFKLLSSETCAHVSDLRIPEIASPLNAIIVGSFNGLLCVTDIEDPGRSVRICNPAIGMYRYVLSTSFPIPLEFLNFQEIQLGFGYHAETDDYKIVRIAYNAHQEMIEAMFNGVDIALLHQNELGLNDVGNPIFVGNNAVQFVNPVEIEGVGEGNDEEVVIDDHVDEVVDGEEVVDFANRMLVEVFSLRENAWQKIDNIATFPWQILELSSGIVVNGAVHWIASHSYPEEDVLVILAFDLSLHTFREIDIPDHRIGFDTRECLGVMDGCLAFIDVSLNRFWGNTPCHVWVMREYGVLQSWNLHAICFIKAAVERPRFLTKGYRLVLEGVNGDLIIYNLVNHEIQIRETDDHIGTLSFAPYTQTMLWFGNE